MRNEGVGGGERTSRSTRAIPRRACWCTDLGALPDISPKALSPSVTQPARKQSKPPLTNTQNQLSTSTDFGYFTSVILGTRQPP